MLPAPGGRGMIAVRASLLTLALATSLGGRVCAQDSLVDPGISEAAALTAELERGTMGQLIPPRTVRQLVLGESAYYPSDTTAALWYDVRRGVLRIRGRDEASRRSWTLVRYSSPADADGRSAPYLALPPRVVVQTPSGPLISIELPDGSRFVTRSLGALDTLYAVGEELLPVLVTRLGGLIPSQDRWATEHYLAKLAKSEVVDSMRRAFGAVERIAAVRESRPGVLGMYYFRADRIELDPSTHAHEGDLLLTWVHEYAHALQRRRGPTLNHLFAEIAPVKTPGIYGYGKRREQQAEALSFAWGFLRATSDTARMYELGVSDRWGYALRARILRGKTEEPLPGEPGPRAAEALARLERLVPGTRRMVALLLTNPVWAEHPLRTGAVPDLAGLAAEPTPPGFWRGPSAPQPRSVAAKARNARAR